MKMKPTHKDFYMEIRKSPGRFLSILFIVALGVAFFSGIRASEPDMRLTGDTYFDERLSLCNVEHKNISCSLSFSKNCSICFVMPSDNKILASPDLLSRGSVMYVSNSIELDGFAV